MNILYTQRERNRFLIIRRFILIKGRFIPPIAFCDEVTRRCELKWRVCEVREGGRGGSSYEEGEGEREACGLGNFSIPKISQDKPIAKKCVTMMHK